MWPAFATHLEGCTGSNCRTHTGPDLSEASQKKTLLRVARKRGKLLRRWGSVVMGQVRSECQNECQNVSQHPMLLMSIGAVLVLLVLTHICARRILNLELLPTVQLRASHKLQSEPEDDSSNLPHLHSRGIEWLTDFAGPHMQSASEFCVHSNSLSLRTSRSEQSA